MSERAPAFSAPRLRSFRRALLGWYDQHQRDLPWRREPSAYRVWISEIMLQQTRVAAVLDYYARFMRRFPDVATLARARESSVLAAWSGLGYYHRARRMQQAAKLIVRRGSFPQTAEEWRQLPGIGRYTAAAIASIAFGEPVAVVDGNVERVLRRVLGEVLNGEVVWERAEALLDSKRPGDFNQAMMELGATVCTPSAPQCPRCPLHLFCRTRGVERVASAPARKSKEVFYALARRGASVLLVQRPAYASLMAGMWELPTLLAEELDGQPPLLRLRHAITDTNYRVAVFAVPHTRLRIADANGVWFSNRQCERLPLTGLTQKVLKNLARL
jgi:A/G-specific adenine glycosylase